MEFVNVGSFVILFWRSVLPTLDYSVKFYSISEWSRTQFGLYTLMAFPSVKVTNIILFAIRMHQMPTSDDPAAQKCMP